MLRNMEDSAGSTCHINLSLSAEVEKLIADMDHVINLFIEFQVTRPLLISALSSLASLAGWLGLTLATNRFDIPLLLLELEGFSTIPLVAYVIGKGEVLGGGSLLHTFYCIHQYINDWYGSDPRMANAAGFFGLVCAGSLFYLFALLKNKSTYERVREFSTDEEKEILAIFERSLKKSPRKNTKDPKEYAHLPELKLERNGLADILHQNNLMKNSIFNALPKIPSDLKEIMLDYSNETDYLQCALLYHQKL